MLGSKWTKMALGAVLGCTAVLAVARTADSQSSAVKVWKEGDVLTAEDLNASLRAAAGGQGLPFVWNAFAPAAQGNGQPAADTRVATFTFTSTVEGSVLVSAHAEVRVRNRFDSARPVDCRTESLIGQAPGFPGCPAGQTCAGPGYTQSTLPAALPTQTGNGAYLGLQHSTSRVLPLVRGLNTFYLSGRTDCMTAFWGAVTFSALQVQPGSPATLTVP